MVVVVDVSVSLPTHWVGVHRDVSFVPSLRVTVVLEVTFRVRNRWDVTPV